MIGGRGDIQLAVRALDQPRPAGPEAAHGGGAKPLFELVEVAEGTLEGLSKLASGLAACFGPHNLPEHRVVDMATTVVADRRADVFRRRGAVRGQQLFQALTGKLWSRFEGLVQVGHISGVVLSVVNLHRRLVDKRFQGIEGIRQRR